MSNIDIDDDELAYLQPGFDPSSLTVPKLRKILLEHNVNYPPTAKKPQLIQAFNQDVVSQRKKILAARARIKRSSKGIVDVPSSQASTVTDEDDDTPPPQPAARRPGRPKGSSRKQSRPLDDEDGDETLLAPPTASRSKRTSKHARSSEVEPDELPTSRNTRRRTGTTPSVKQEELEPRARPEYDGESPFSSDNPFQSGSSPPAPSTSSRRRADGEQEKKLKKRSTSGRRKTDIIQPRQQEDGFEPPSRTFEMRVLPRSKRTVAMEEPEFEAGEDFVPEEREELEMERRRSGNTAVIPVRRTGSRGRKQSTVVPGFMAVFTVFLACFAYLWRQEKFRVGYCGIGRPSDRIAGVDIPDWADFLRPDCENCPQHAICFSDLQTTCENDFVLNHHPLSLGGFLPLPPTCEPDGEKAKRVKAVADKAIDELRNRRAEAECGEKDQSGHPVDSPELDESTLKEHVGQKRKKSMSDEEFEGLWAPAIGEVIGRDEVTVEEVSGQRRFASSSLSKLSLSCSIRRSFKLTMGRYLKPLLILLSAFVAFVYVKWQIADRRKSEQEANKLVSNVLDSLAEYATVIAYEASGLRDGYVSVSQLRDDVLRDEHSASRRNKLWKKVEKKVEVNSNVRSKVGTLDSGDVGRAWKWIGALRVLEEGGTGSRRGSSRFSLPSAVGSSPMTEIQRRDTPDSHSGSSFTRWDESSRPRF